MKIFIDSAEISDITKAVSWGIIDGATTNPSLIKKAVENRNGKITMEDYIKNIIETVPGPVSLEVIGLGSNEMIKQGKLLFEKFSSYGEIAIKIPINPSVGNDNLEFEGLKAIKELSSCGIAINTTLIMTPEQALLAAKAGSDYVSPFAGRIDDYIRNKLGLKTGLDFEKSDYFNSYFLKKVSEKKFDFESTSKNSKIKNLWEESQDNGIKSGVDLVAKILEIFKIYGFKTEVIAASVRNARQVREIAALGAHISTLPFYVIKEMIYHYKTVEGIKNFTKDIVLPYKEIFGKEN